ncbi:Trm112 family protein [soil metagenome]
MATVDKKLLEILACPLSKAPLLLDGERLVSTDPDTRRSYPITDGIPVLFVESGEELDPATHQEIMQRHGAQPFVKTSGKKTGK